MASLIALWNLNYDDPLVVEIYELRVDLEVKSYQVKAHIDVQGNDNADRIAKSDAGRVVANIHSHLPLSFIKH